MNLAQEFILHNLFALQDFVHLGRDLIREVMDVDSLISLAGPSKTEQNVEMGINVRHADALQNSDKILFQNCAYILKVAPLQAIIKRFA